MKAMAACKENPRESEKGGLNLTENEGLRKRKPHALIEGETA
jgi:hypothetical protein